MALFNSGVDWITLSVKGDPGAIQFSKVWDDHHIVPKKWVAMGYTGYRCSETGLRWGDRVSPEGEMETILIASGKPSDELARDYIPSCDARCTRIDFQATLFLDDPRSNLATDLYRGLRLAKDIGKSRTGRRQLSLIQSETGQTLYVGSRSGGSKFFRFYDKSYAYDCDPGTVWRQEVQYGRRYSQQAYERLLDKEFDERDDWIVAIVESEFIEAMGESLVQVALLDDREVIPGDRAIKGSIEARLRWLKTCVRPAVASLRNQGYDLEAMQAILGYFDASEFDEK